ncbi:aldehyde dehydrogenase family protein [Candidatus Uhrbacteria bacterium]|nr:aldehyde dehydrogenase family protein [Candidatus Uhrbacteria bacterium]
MNANAERVEEPLDYSPAPESDKDARAWLKLHGARFGHFINGAWVCPATGGRTRAKRYFTTSNPETGETFAQVAVGTQAHVDQAMAAAQKAFGLWSALSGFVRARYLYAIARTIAKHARILAVLESLDNGKPIRETRDIDVPGVIRWFYYFAGWAKIMLQAYPNRQPVGVICQIVPWNFPLLMIAWKVAAAIAAGNTVVLKTSEYTPLSALYLAELLMEEVKLPKGVVNFVFGDLQTGQLMVRHQTPKKVAFTGSTRAGRDIRLATAGSGKLLTLELGGKSPMVVYADADLDAVVEGAVDGVLGFNNGQVCCAGSRLLVHESIADELIARLKARMSKLRGGKSLDKAYDTGAVNSAAQRDKIAGLVAQCTAEGGDVWQPDGWVCPPQGYHYAPTLCTKVNTSHTIVREEVFGPVLIVMTFRTPSEAAMLANNTRYGLAASVWTQNIGLAHWTAAKIKAGTVWVNCTQLFDPASGFGGYRESGYGREGGIRNILDLTVEKFDPPTPEPMAKRGKRAHPQLVLTDTDALDETHRFLVGGKLVRPDGAASIRVRDPHGNIVGIVGDANRKDVRNAVRAARGAAESWAGQTAHGRAQILYFMAEKVMRRKEALAITIAAQTGRSMDSARAEVNATSERLFHWGGWADKFEGQTPQVSVKGMHVVALNESVGVIGIRAPDEYPLLGLVSTMASAIAMGNAVVIVAGKCAFSAMDLVEIIQNSDVPAGVVNILTAKNPDAIVEMFASHEDVDAVWCFGGAEASRKVEAASVCNMKRTLVSYGRLLNWVGPEGESTMFLDHATQQKNIWFAHAA